MNKPELIETIVDYTCVIKIWEYKDYSGRTCNYSTVHPKR